MRTRFLTDVDGQPVQHIDDASRLCLELAEPPIDADPSSWLLEEASRDARRGFDLAEGPLLRARLLSTADEQHVLSFNLHHIVADGWSVSVLARELATLYRAFATGEPSPLEELPIQYADYAAWQREVLSGDELDHKLAFWKAELEGANFQLSLPKKPGARGHSYAGATLHVALDSALATDVDTLALQLEATPFMVLLRPSRYAARVGGKDDLVIGTPIANRNRLETEPLIGLFVNTLVVRADLRDDPPFAGLVRQLRERMLRAQPHEDLPFEKLVDALHVERDLERTPIFQVMFAMQNTPPVAFDLAGVG